MAGKRTPPIKAKYSPEAELKESSNKNSTSVPSTASSDISDQRSGYFSKSSVRSSE